MTAETYQQLYQRACERKGGEQNLQSLISRPRSREQLCQLGADRYLAEFSKKVFQSGFVWRVVEQKWPDFESLFFQFDIEKILLMPDEMLEQKATDKRIIRNYKKVQCIRDNAMMIDDVNRREGSFAEFVADWPSEDIIGLWSFLKKHGARLGGNTGPYALRALGKDSFILSRDLVGYFTQRQLISGGTTSKRSLTTIQNTFNDWQQQSGLSLQEIAKTLVYGVGDNHVQVE